MGQEMAALVPGMFEPSPVLLSPAGSVLGALAPVQKVHSMACDGLL